MDELLQNEAECERLRLHFKTTVAGMGVPSRVSGVIERGLLRRWADWDSFRAPIPAFFSAVFPQLAVVRNLSCRTRPAPGLAGRVGRCQWEVNYRCVGWGWGWTGMASSSRFRDRSSLRTGP